MKVFTRDYRIQHNGSPVWSRYFGGLKPCVLDIETTGLSPDRCKCIMVALLVETEDGVRIVQFLAENHYEEYKVLDAASEFLEENHIDYCITYNGQSFDIPFLNTRAAANHMDYRFNLYNFDLYRFVKKFSTLPSRMSSLSQKSLEIYYGIGSDRKDTITGRESVALYNQYAVDGNGTAEKIILTHNREDVLQLYKLMMCAGADDFSAILRKDLHSALAEYGFPASDCAATVRIKYRKKDNHLLITGDQLRDAFDAAYFPDEESPVCATFSSLTRSYEISLPLMEHAGCYYVDLVPLGLMDDATPDSNSESLASDQATLADSESLTADPDYVNGFLVMNSRSVNKLAALLVEKYRGL